MPNEAKRSRGDHAETRGVHHLDIPMLAHGAYDPQSHPVGGEKYGEHQGSQEREKRPAKKYDFQGGANQNDTMNEHDPAELRFVYFCSPTSDQFLLMAPGNTKLEPTQKRNREQQGEKGDDG
jgi:hypothetical protein